MMLIKNIESDFIENIIQWDSNNSSYYDLLLKWWLTHFETNNDPVQ